MNSSKTVNAVLAPKVLLNNLQMYFLHLYNHNVLILRLNPSKEVFTI